MSSVLIKEVQVFSSEKNKNTTPLDILIIDGIIKQIETNISSDGIDTVIEGNNAWVSPGFFDLNANFGEPGLETKEDLFTGTQAAIFGGFTGVALHPNTQPALHTHSEVAYIKEKAKSLPIEIFPMGTVSKNREGKELAEIYDMQTAGAIAFTDGNKSIHDPSLMSKALLYIKGLNGLVIAFPEDQNLTKGAFMNEGDVSTYLGLKGKPNIAESLMVARDLYLAEYHDARIHFTTISTKESVELIREAKRKGIKVTADVAAHHLVLTDEEVKSFDSHYKVNPPLRTQEDQEALFAGLLDGTIDAICTQHTPHEVEFKNVEFQIAYDGIITLQTTLSILSQTTLPVELLIEKMAVNPRKIVGLEVPKIEIGEKANLILLDLNKNWIFEESLNLSKSKNSPFIGKELKGKVSHVIIGNHLYNNQ